MADEQPLLGPETITVYKLNDDKSKKEGDVVVKLNLTDNQQKAWNCSNPEIIPHIKPGETLDVWYHTWSPPDGSFTSKYIQKAAPSKNPPQELKEPYKGGGGGGGNRGGGGGKKGDFRTHGEILASYALNDACTIVKGLMPVINADSNDPKAAATKARVLAMEIADVFAEYVQTKGKELEGKSGASAGGESSGGGWSNESSEAPKQESAGWAGGSEDDDIPF